ncbi:FecR family protein [Flavobacterium granuli]|uniref:FecR family protein n=1 Tax=Flavobacterium granuli TaxID=280093 RepID=A0A1M5IY05_9FLAO|nr:FecR family protein [Flavobacterium granuli]PRZ28156.1 FecR family protein [Flavobacterium granuli]SHG33202.1 FecR family protein [Flavobacterium granuli]
MNTIPPNILAIISTYTSKEIGEVEFVVLKQWIDESSENEALFSEYLLFYKKSRRIAFAETADKDKAWQNILSQLERPLESANVREKPKYRRRIIKQASAVMKYAAVVIFFLTMGYFYFQKDFLDKSAFKVPAEAITLQLENGAIQIIKDDGSSQIIDANGNVVGSQKGNQLVYSNTVVKDSLVYNTINVPYGKRFELQLSDGTSVHLNSGTSLKYPVRFIKGESRQVFLDGEAYFDVTKDSKHPFVVRSNDMDVKVLGTRFNVTSYHKDEKTYAVLVEGSVAAYSKLIENEHVLLKPGNRAYFENKQLKTEAVDIDKYVAWVSGELMFIDDSFGVIANKLERKYNVDIVNNYDDLNDIVITATFKEENIYQVLKTFQTYKAFDFTINNRVITITKPKKMQQN